MYGTHHCSGPVVPAPTPPWLRPVQSPAVQYLFGAGTVDLGVDTTYLSQTNPSGDGLEYNITLPAGNYQRQIKRIYIPATTAVNSAAFIVFGALVGCNSLLLNSAAVSAVLEWDGAGWQIIGGNAQPSNKTQP